MTEGTTAMNPKTLRRFEAMMACPEGMGYLKKHRSFTQAWLQCERGEWLVWLLDNLRIDLGRRKQAAVERWFDRWGGLAGQPGVDKVNKKLADLIRANITAAEVMKKMKEHFDHRCYGCYGC